jgi:hypothetical protein
VENYGGREACIRLVGNYDANEIIPLLMIMFEVLHLLFKHVQYKLLDLLLDLVTLLKKSIIYLVWVHL